MTATCFCTAPATTGALCTDHLKQLRKHLWLTPEILRELDVTITNQAKQGGNNGSGERMAFNEAASDRRQDVLVVLRSAAHAADPQARHRYDEPPAELVARALGGLDALARSPQVHTIVQDLADALVSAEQAVGRAPERRVLGQCECGTFVTTRRTEGLARCPQCSTEYDIAQWDANRVELVGEARDHAATLPALAGFFTRHLRVPVSARTLQRWAREGRIQPAGEVEVGKHPEYRVGDVLDAWAAVEAQKAAEGSEMTSEAV